MTQKPIVSIGIPVYEGAAFLQATLRSIQVQTYHRIEVMISLDGPQPDSEKICEQFLDDPRFQLVIQPERLGWVGNLNWLMKHAKTPFWYLNPQDDLVDPTYVETLLDHAHNFPKAATVYCDIRSLGFKTDKIIQSSVSGSALTRQLNLLLSHLPAVAFRGLTRLEALRHTGSIPSNSVDNFAVDTTWMAAMARWGDLIRVPAELYRKRYHANNEHIRWLDWPLQKKTKAWIAHCIGMLEQALFIPASYQEKRLIWLAGVERLLSNRFGFLPKRKISSPMKKTLYLSFLECITKSNCLDIPALLNDDWENIKDWTDKAFWSSPVNTEALVNSPSDTVSQ